MSGPFLFPPRAAPGGVSSRVYVNPPLCTAPRIKKKGDFERKFSAKSVFIDLSEERVLDKLLFLYYTRLRDGE